MNVSQNVSLTKYSSMGVGGTVAYLGEVTDRMQVLEALSWAQSNNLKTIMIGEGNNVIWQDGVFDGFVLVNKISSYEVYQEDATNFYVTVGAGENWDAVVARTVEAGLTGIEALSLIPGTAGATPIQNVGAYGQELSQVLVTVEAFDILTHNFVTIPASDCGLGYRTSRFKTNDRGRFFITRLTMHLIKANPLSPFYPSVQSYFETNNIIEFTPEVLRKAVVEIRQSKLPNPKIIRNNGSFFANPIISEDLYAEISENYENIPHWPTDSGQVKMSGAWLIEQSGYKNVHDNETGMATWENQPLVLVNEHAKSTADVLAFKQKIVNAVSQKFGITLVQEPELLP